MATVSVRYIVDDVDAAIGSTSMRWASRWRCTPVLVDDPSGNPVELFQPTRREARLGSG